MTDQGLADLNVIMHELGELLILFESPDILVLGTGSASVLSSGVEILREKMLHTDDEELVPRGGVLVLPASWLSWDVKPDAQLLARDRITLHYARHDDVFAAAHSYIRQFVHDLYDTEGAMSQFSAPPQTGD